jgi:hypothetical protein
LRRKKNATHSRGSPGCFAAQRTLALDYNSGFWFAVLAEIGVEASLGQTKTLHRLSFYDVRLHDLLDVSLGYETVPNGIGINDDVWSVLALVETACLIGAHAAFESTFGELLFEEFLQPALSFGIAASAGMPCRTLVSADEDVSFEFWHENALLDIDQGIFLILTAAAIKQKWRAPSSAKIGCRNL